MRRKVRSELEARLEDRPLGSGWLSGVPPRFHHWHHGEEREAIDVNFAIHFPLLDRLFGTHHMLEGRWPKNFGIEGHPVPQGYWQQFLYPFKR